MRSFSVRSHHEERIISRFCALRVCRYMLCILLFPLYFVHYPTAVYPLAALLVFPPFLNLLLETSHPDDNQAAVRQSSIPQIMEQYHFSYTKYQSERICFIIGLILLAVWQWIQPAEYWYDLPLGRVPLILLVFYYVSQVILSFCYRFSIQKALRSTSAHEK